MSKQDDVLFCNIAIAQGLVTKDAAAKALGLCDKREQETGRRPLIGAVFTKYNILENQDVQRIYGAVQKRLGRSAGPQLAVAKGKKGKKGKTALSSFDKRSKPTRPIDPKTLWLGIGGIVVFAAIVVVMFILVMTPSGKPKTEAGGGDASGTTSSIAKTGGPGGGPAGKTGGAASATGATKREIPADVQLQVDSKIGDAVSGMGVGPEEGLSGLKLVEKQLREKGYEPPQKLLEAIQQLEQRVKEEGGAAEAPAPTPAPAATPAAAPEPAGETAAPKAAGTPAGTPAEKPKEAAPATDDVESLIDDL